MNTQESVTKAIKTSLIFHIASALIVFTCCMMNANSVNGFTDNEPAGLYLNKTSSYSASQFYQKLGFLLHANTNLGSTNLVVKETVNAKSGSLLQITQGTKVLYQTLLSPREKNVDSKVLSI